ncbi:MAG: DUF748 domain-containing protein [Cyclobacteriaceae bacterium]|nr:DUF748 domain-containing protein [Cyclobacteriaceae bacterium]
MWKRPWVKITLIVLLALGVVSYLILPVAAEWYLESRDEELIGRRLEINDIDFNLLTGGITVENLTLYESDKETPFVQWGEFYVNIAWGKLLFGTFGLEELRLLEPKINIRQKGPNFNYDDLVARFASGDSSSSTEPSEPLSYQVLNIMVSQGVLAYRQMDLQAEVKLVQVNASCPIISSADPRQDVAFDFRFDQGGKAKGIFHLNQETLSYRTEYALDSLNLGIFFPYLADYMRTGKLHGLFTSHQTIAGNLNTPTDVATTGMLRVNDFALTDPAGDKLIGMGEMKMEIDSIDLGQSIYALKYVRLDHPYLKVELYDEGNNFSRLMNEAPPDDTGISSDSLSKAAAYGNVFALMAAYIRELSHLYVFSDYQADSLVLRGGTLVFNDFTLHNRFNYLLEKLMVKADKVSSDKTITVEAESILNTSGRLNGQLLVDPHGFSNMTIDYSITGLRVSDFNPYSDYYVAHPFTDGVCSYVSKSTVRDQHLKSNHILDIESIKVGKKVKNSTAYNIPVRLAVALLRDKNGDVHIELPIEGNLNDPNYKVGKVIWQVFRNLISKAVAAPGKLLAGKAGVEERLLEGFDWSPLQTTLTDAQRQSLDALVRSLETTPEMKVELLRLNNDPLETDELAVREGKKKFLFFHRRIGSEEVIQPEEMARLEEVPHQDSTFNAYLNQQVSTDGELVSVYEKSKRLAGSARLQRLVAEMYQQRTEAIVNYLTTAKGLSPERFSVGDPATPPSLAYATPSRVTFRFFVDE